MQSGALEGLTLGAGATFKSATYADLKAKADDRKLKVFPIMYGRAKALLGLVKMAPRGQGRVALARAATAEKRSARGPRSHSKSARIRELLGTGMSAAEIAKEVGATPALVYVVKSASNRGASARSEKRGPGRPRKSAENSTLGSLSSLVDAVKASERQRTQLRDVLTKIKSVISDALS